jgi:N-methylhydantoinase B/oxoprolinase/acetone carboxylase alpha subunit
MTFSCYHSSERLYPWGLFGGGEGTLSSFRVRLDGESEYRTFKERFGVRCAGKFTNVQLPARARLELKVGGGGGYGPPGERDPERIAIDLLGGFVDEDYVRRNHPDQLESALQIRDRLLEQLRAGSRR